MKNTLATILFFSILPTTACGPDTPTFANGIQSQIAENTGQMNDTLVIKIGDQEFTAILFDSPTGNAFKSILPLTINMTELNGNEKYFRLPKNLPTDESNPGRVNSGDLMLYGSHTLVLFYETFSTSHRYTKLGKITNTRNLAAALGGGNVSVSISTLK